MCAGINNDGGVLLLKGSFEIPVFYLSISVY